MKNAVALSAVLLGLATATSAARAGFTFAEAVNGDLSNDRLDPTHLVLSAGANTLTGTTVTLPAPAGRDFDYLTLTVPAGLQFDSLVLTAYGGDDLTFVGMVAGTPFNVAPTDPAASIPPRLLGWVHMTPALIGSDLFRVMTAQTVPAPVIGFTAPLRSGDYSFWIQEAGAATVDYALTFNVSAVPEPSTLMLLAPGALVGLALARRRRSGLEQSV